MTYVVVVLEPIPSDLHSAAASVAEGFRIPPDKALALLHRAPGPVTRGVPEKQARTVANILQAAGLAVEVREGGPDGPAVAVPAPGRAMVTTASGGVAAGYGEVTRNPSQSDASWDGATGRSVRTTAARAAAPAVLEGPAPGATTTTPPRDPMKTTLTRDPPELNRNSLRRRIATAGTLPAILTLLVTMLALWATLLPQLRAQQLKGAGDTALAMAASIEGLSSGLPLSAPLIRSELRLVEERTRAGLFGRGYSFVTVLDADGTPLLEWGASEGGAMPASLRVLAWERARSAADTPNVLAESWSQSLRASGRTLLAMFGLAEEEPAVATVSIRRGGTPIGTVVVGAEPSGFRGALGRVLLTTLLVGLIPVLFAVLASLSLTRGLTDAIRYLLVAADRISHGDFEQPVELKRDDELGQIGIAIDRMRLSLREGMERLRRRR